MIAQPLVVSPDRRIAPGPEADRLALAAYDAMLADLRALDDEEWDRPTECAPWTVRDLTAHLVGAAEGHARPRELVRQSLQGRRRRRAHDGNDLDAMNQLQIDEHAHLSPQQLVAELERLAALAVAGRARLARRLGWAPVPLAGSGSAYDGMPSRVSVRELASVVLTRDVWMHRLDVARAVGRPTPLTPELDGRLVEDLVVEWCLRHGRPVQLALTGDAGGSFVAGAGGDPLTMDAVDFVRTLAGRRAEGPVPPSPLWRTKVLF